MKKDFFKVLFVAAVALLTVSCSDKDKDNDVTVDRKVAVLLPDDSMISTVSAMLGIPPSILESTSSGSFSWVFFQ